MSVVDVPLAPPAPTMPANRPDRLSSLLSKGNEWTTLADHRTRFAPPPAVGRAPDRALTEEVERAGLRGRGGAAFPTATKFRAVAAGRRRAVVLANGSEGEPASFKDALLMSAAPHLVLDGALLAASAVGADEVILGIKYHAGHARNSIERALAERYTSEPATARVRVLDVPPRYLAGEERALVNLVNRGRAIPPAGNARPFEQGVGGRPTLVQNVETLAHVALIRRNGADWFRGVGTDEAPGTALVSVGGAVEHPGVYEIATGVPFVDLLSAVGGATGEIGGVLMGGYAGTWLSAEEAVRVRLDRKGLAAVGGIFGCGAIVVLPASACGVRETAFTLRWLADQTAGQCGPCVHGLGSIASATEALRTGRADPKVPERLSRWANDIEGRGACRYPDGALRFLRSALKTFAPEIRNHVRGRPCASAERAAILPLPDVWRAA
jgi:NADH:ubiquinone oxidoreductase subunit F (NADH-binding)